VFHLEPLRLPNGPIGVQWYEHVDLYNLFDRSECTAELVQQHEKTFGSYIDRGYDRLDRLYEEHYVPNSTGDKIRL
jgi:hypothetical protein